MNIPEDKLRPIKEAIYRGEKILAIKLYREAAGVGLVDAKNEVERIETELRGASPEKFKTVPAGKGCLGVVLAAFAVAAASVWLRVSR